MQARVYDLIGKAIESWPLASNDTHYLYNIAGLSPGTYLIKIVNGNGGEITKKFIKSIG